MKKSTKGAIAAGAAAVLLLGGAGTLAYWSDAENIAGGVIDTGTLALSTPDCDDWEYAADNANPGGAVDIIVPGDKITKTCTFDIEASGDNLQAVLTTPTSATFTSDPNADSLTLNVAADYKIDGQAVPATITSNNGGDTVTATITIDFPFGTAQSAGAPININNTQGLAVTLDDIAITLVQQES